MADIEPLGMMERWELAHAASPEDRGGRAKLVEGLTSRQAALLGVLVAFGGETPLTARDFEAQLARTSGRTGIVGWAASDCTIGLNRLLRRGLVSREAISGAGRSRGQARQAWRITEDGERLYQRWLMACSPEFAEYMQFAARAQARRLAS